MQRRSKRLRVASEPNNINLDDNDVDKLDVASKKASKVKKSTTEPGGSQLRRSVKGKRGQLEKIPQLPLDILFEIFSQLDPIDILNLSRVSKPLRNILLRRSSAYIWKNARARIPGLPECPIDLSEPAYANLVFYPYCQFCLKAYVNSKAILWMLRTRACKKCFAEHFERFPRFCDVSTSVMPYESIANNRGYTELFVNKYTLCQHLAEKKGLEGPALDEWCSRKHSELAVRRKHANRCDKWNQTRNIERSNELDNLRDQRYQAIKAKLSDLGWGEEISHLENSAYGMELPKHRLSEHKLVKQPKPLTERIWNNIKDALTEFMEKAKARRLDKLRRDTISRRGKILFQVLETYASSQPLHAILPSVADVAVLPAVRAIIEDTPIEEELSELHFQQLMVDFPQVATDWRQSKDEALIKLINNHPETDTNATLTTLRYAGTFFHCNRCSNMISYPRILVHCCLTKVNWRNTDIDEYFKNLCCQPWDLGLSHISYAHEASERARLILHHCQLVSEHVTNEALIASELCFECTQCRSDQGRLLMRWPIVIDHATSWHVSKDPNGSIDGSMIEPANLTLAEAALAHLLTYFQMSPMSGDRCHSTDWICLECKRRLPWSASWKHLKEMHPGLIPADYNEFEHERKFERYMTLHLDAHRNILYAPIRVNVDDPVHGFRDALQDYTYFFFDGEPALDTVSEQLAQAFLMTIGNLVPSE